MKKTVVTLTILPSAGAADICRVMHSLTEQILRGEVGSGKSIKIDSLKQSDNLRAEWNIEVKPV